MAENPSKLQRWLDVVAFLAGRRFPVTVEELWAGVPAYAEGLEGGSKDPESVRRMFERDKDELRALGIPIESRSFGGSLGDAEGYGYQLARKDFHLPYLRLVREAEAEAGAAGTGAPGREPGRQPAAGGRFAIREAEVGAALDGLRDVMALPGFPLARQARSAYRKLAFDLDPDLLEPPPVLFVEDPETAAAAETLRRLSEALLARKRVEMRYRSMGRDEEAVRTVRPYGLLFQHGRWYLVAHAEDRNEVRMFRVGRVAGVRVNDQSKGTPDYRIPEDFDLRQYAGRQAWELGDEGAEPDVEALVRFRFPRSIWAERNGHGTLVEEAEDGSQLRSIRVRRADPFLRWVLSLEGDARVEAPAELREAFHSVLAAVARRYGADPEGGPDRG